MDRCTDKGWERAAGLLPRITLDGDSVSQFCGLGTFADRMLLHEGAVAKISKDMPLDRACVLGCGGVTGLGAALRTARVGVGDHVAVIGCGGVGLSAIQGARLGGASRIIAVDQTSKKLDLALHFGATDVVDASVDDAVARVRELAPGGVDHALECVGTAALVRMAWDMTGLGGQVTVDGGVPQGVNVAIPGNELIQTEKRLTGSTWFRLDMPMYVDLYLQGRLNLDDMVSSCVEHQGVEAAADDINATRDAMQSSRGVPARSVFVLDPSPS